MRIAIWDLDNCLANDTARRSKIVYQLDDFGARISGDYRAYHELCGVDQPHAPHVAIFQDDIKRGLLPLFFTGRPEYVRYPTLRWIERHLGVNQPLVVMRDPNDTRPSVELKREMLVRRPELWTNISAAYDDSRDIIDMYRSFGIAAIRLAIDEGDHS